MKPVRLRHARHEASLLLTSLFLTCCGGAQGFQKGFDTGWASGGRSEAAVLERLQKAPAPAVLPAAVGVTGRGLVGRSLPDGKRWEYTGEVDTLPVLSGGAVAISGGGVVTLIDVKSGEVIWNDVPSGGRLLESMAYDGQRALLVLADPDDSRPDLLLSVLAKSKGPNATGATPGGTATHTGEIEKERRVTSEAAIGRPAALPGLALVPWNAEYLTALDLGSGEPIGVLRVPNAATAVQASARGFLLLGRGAVAVDEHLLDDKPPKPLTLPRRKLPGNPAWPGDGAQTQPARSQGVAVLARPERRGSKLELAGGAYASAFHRVVLGFDAKKGNLRWATYFLRDIMGGSATDQSATLCLEDGSIWRLSWKDGARAPSGGLEARLRACVVEADPRPVTATVAEPLVSQIATTLINTGPDMAPVHGLLLDELSKNPSGEVTGILLDIAQSPSASADLADRAAKRIGQRRKGTGPLIAALEASPDGESAKRPPPLSPIANALSAMNAKKAAGPLAAHLLDPRASVNDQLAIARALYKLADENQTKALGDYFSLYRAAASEPELAEAVLSVAETLWRVGGREGRSWVTNAARDPMTHPTVRAGLERLLARVDPPAASAAPAASGGTQDPSGPAASDAAPPARVPTRRP